MTLNNFEAQAAVASILSDDKTPTEHQLLISEDAFHLALNSLKWARGELSTEQVFGPEYEEK